MIDELILKHFVGIDPTKFPSKETSAVRPCVCLCVCVCVQHVVS